MTVTFLPEGDAMSWVTFVVFGAFVAVALFVMVRRSRPGGPGPAVNYVPPPLPGAVNSYYRQRGRQGPFDVTATEPGPGPALTAVAVLSWAQPLTRDQVQGPLISKA